VIQTKSDNKIIIGLLFIIIILMFALAFKIYSVNNTDYTEEYNNYAMNTTVANEETNTFQNEDNEISYEEKISTINELEALKIKEEEYVKDNTFRSSNGILRSSGPDYLVIITFLIVITLVLIVPIVSLWKIFSDHGIPGWQSIVPILSLYRMYQLVGIPTYCILALFIPYVGQIIILICSLIFSYKLAQLYEKGIVYTLGLIFLPFIFYPLIAFKK